MTRHSSVPPLAFHEEEPGTSPHPRLAAPAHGLQVLFVDDDPLSEMTLRRALRRLGKENPLRVAHDGLEALEVLADPFFPIDRTLILLDLNMPRMDGHEFLKELRADRELARLPVVVMTTSDEPKDIARAYEQGVAGYFLKPVAFSEFITQLDTLFSYWSRAIVPRVSAGLRVLAR